MLATFVLWQFLIGAALGAPLSYRAMKPGKPGYSYAGELESPASIVLLILAFFVFGIALMLVAAAALALIAGAIWGLISVIGWSLPVGVAVGAAAGSVLGHFFPHPTWKNGGAKQQ